MDELCVIDSHAHLDAYSPEELHGVLERMAAARVKAISIGTHPEDWEGIAAIAAAHPDLVLGYTVGVHPTEIKEDWRAQLKALEDHLSAHTVLAIGEIGLDYYKLDEKADRLAIVERQRKMLPAQLAIAKSANTPIVIHSRGSGAFDEVVAAIDSAKLDWGRVVFHCFSESAERVRELNARGGRASFTGVVTFRNAHITRGVLAAQPKELLMVETDCPYMTPEPHRGEKNEPANVVWVLKKAAEIFGDDPAALAKLVRTTTENFFGVKA